MLLGSPVTGFWTPAMELLEVVVCVAWHIRPHHTKAVSPAGKLREMRPEAHPGQPGGDMACDRADIGRGIWFGIPQFKLAGAAVQEQQQHLAMGEPFQPVGLGTLGHSDTGI